MEFVVCLLPYRQIKATTAAGFGAQSHMVKLRIPQNVVTGYKTFRVPSLSAARPPLEKELVPYITDLEWISTYKARPKKLAPLTRVSE